nr:hypothetical protein [Acidipropionibacterium virtanenii]
MLDVDVVEAVAGQPVDLVHQAHLDPRCGDEREHLLECWPVGGACGLARIHELADDPGTEVGGLPCVGFALGGDGEAFLGAAALGLLTCGHP